MEDVTPLFSTYRQCVQHLWNDYFLPIAEPTQAWNVRDEFDAVSLGIFSSLVSRPLGAFDHSLAPAWSAEPASLPCFHVVPAIEDGTPIFFNRDLPRSGYWDHPISLVRPRDVELHLLRFFDWGQTGYRDYVYLEAVVHASPTHPEVVGRAALIEFGHAKVLFNKAAV